MRNDVVVEVSAVDRSRLEAIVADRNSPQKHVWRARMVLLTGALLDRLTHHVHILEINGDSYRLKQSKQRQHRT